MSDWQAKAHWVYHGATFNRSSIIVNWYGIHPSGWASPMQAYVQFSLEPECWA